MIRIFSIKCVLSILLIGFVATQSSNAQQAYEQDYTTTYKIPRITALKASETHLYALSEQDGMIVFRIYPDKLQWLYTSEGMQRRGKNIETDVRFAYIFGNTKRLTVLEPTSVLGVYSATFLPHQPKAVARLSNHLFVALGTEGIGKLALDTPEDVDSDIEIIDIKELENANVIDVASSRSSRQLLVLTKDNKLHILNYKEGEITIQNSLTLSSSISNIFIDGVNTWAANNSGDIFEIRSNGLGKRIGNVESAVTDIINWNNYIFVRNELGEVWVKNEESPINLWKDDAEADNFIAKSLDRLWISENGNLSQIKLVETDEDSTHNSAALSKPVIKKIANQIITFPNPLLLNLELENNSSANDITFTFRSKSDNANIRKQGFSWQPMQSQIGLNQFTIIASNSAGESDSTQFNVDVRSFNSPPVFNPVRNSTIVTHEKFELQFKATDPEDPNSQLIRYIGVDLPTGSKIEEQTGLFSWTPTEKHEGTHNFKVIATDEYGAAASTEVTLKVIDISRD